MMKALIAVAIIFLTGIPVASFFMWSGARIAGIACASFKRSLLVASISGMIIWLATMLFSVLPEIGTLIGFTFGIFMTIFAIRMLYDTSYSKAFLAWVFNVFAQIVTIFIVVASEMDAIQAVMRS